MLTSLLEKKGLVTGTLGDSMEPGIFVLKILKIAGHWFWLNSSFLKRLILFIVACFYTFVSTLFIGLIKDGAFKRWLNWYSTLILHRILSRVFSAIITFHNKENKAKPGSICTANHTSVNN